MPTTPKYLLPYPNETDPADVPVDLQKLAVQVDTQLDLWVPKTAVGVANGVASLDGAGHVPASQLNIVIPPATPPPAFVTALPGSPVDDQEAILVDSLSAPTYAWHLRYKTAVGKWVFLGGSPVSAFSQTVTAPAAGGSYVAMAGAPALTIPRAGVYNLSLSADLTLSRSGNAIEVSLSGAGLAAGTAYAVRNDQRNSADNPSGNAVIYLIASFAKRMRSITLAAGTLTVLGAFTQAGGIGSIGVGYVEIEAEPVLL